MTRTKIFVVVIGLFTLAGCSWVELPPPRSNPRDIVMDTALAQLDRPYRYRGADPTGFDAGGLVRHVYAQSGIALPPSVEGQHAQGQAISFENIRRGDLLFYRMEDSRYPEMHVGIYVGRSRMVHILQNDRVRLDVIDTPYWQRRLLDAVSYLP